MRMPTLPLVRRKHYENEVARLGTMAQQARDTAEIASEAVVDLERQLYEPGWIRALHQLEVEFSAEGMRQLRAVCRLYSIKNPLIRRGVMLIAAYVWARPLNISARATGEDGQQDVRAVVNAFVDNPTNRRELTGSQAHVELEAGGFGTDGEIYFALFTKPSTGTVQVMRVLADQVTDIACDPENAHEPWYYIRQWEVPDGTGGAYKVHRAAYPALAYRPRVRPKTIRDGIPVRWDAPMLHAAVNRPSGWKRGIPDSYAAVDWARAYRIFLEDWATLMRALARYAWQTNVPGDKAKAMRTRLREPVETTRGEPSYAGQTAILPADVALQAVSKTGASFDAESGRPLAAMAASALGVPVTMLLADPGTAGARSVAETLDQPTELPMELRRQQWTAIYRDILDYVIREAVRAPKGSLKGRLILDEYGVETVELDGDTDANVNLEWPDMDQGDLAKKVDAIVKAHSTRTVPQSLILRLLGQALGVAGIDAIIQTLVKDDPEFNRPPQPDDLLADPDGPGALARAGGDPSRAGAGTMGSGGGGNPSGQKE